MKHTKRTAVLLVVLVLICAIGLSLVACNKNKPDGEYKYDPEKRPFSMSISTPDGVFNPFFSTSAYDSEILSLTQVAMLNTDPNGQIVVGDNEPTVVKDYTVTENNVVNGKAETTTYEFLIKNGIKFSNGSPLTIRDVLFNLYVYLDPVYTGSATIYSTDIIGLQAYRQQDRSLLNSSATGSSDFEKQFIRAGSDRIDLDIDYVKVKNKWVASKDKPTLPSDFGAEDEAQAILDFAYIAKTFYEELQSDWNATSVEGYKDWNFEEKWQIFLMNDGYEDGFLARENGPDSSYLKDDKGNYQMDEAYSDSREQNLIGPYLIEAGLAVKNGDSYEIKDKSPEGMEKVDEAIGKCCIDFVFTGKFTRNFPTTVLENNANRLTLNATERAAVIGVIEEMTASNFEQVAKYWGTATTALAKFTAEAKTDYLKTLGKQVPAIPGITVRKTSSFNGKNLGEDHDVLCIEINGVDPKAIYNFGFIVAPMYYYSSTDWNGKNYVAAASNANIYAGWENSTGEFGLEFGNSSFMNEVVNASTKIKLPMGAGSYMASSVDGGVGTDKTFFNNNMVYYERNPFFHTLGSGIENAKIKYLRYKVVESDQILNALTNGDIDYGDPSAKKETEDDLKRAGLITRTVKTNGYGYVGINPRFVPDVNVRRAIIKALNIVQIREDYYKGGFSDLIYRPMPGDSDYYPEGAPPYESVGTIGGGIGIGNVTYTLTPEQGFDEDFVKHEIETLIIDAGYTKRNNVYHRNIPKFGDDILNYKFTIAGGSTDHPAYKMFLQAADLLNSIGWNVRVVTSQQALSDLSSGKLAVWAAAWSSSIDPDMYQVYHKESQASSVKNWGYPQILGGTNDDAWGDELLIVNALSDVIEAGRATTIPEQRKPIYAAALDLVMELAVECPIYQRRDLMAYQSDMLDPDSLPASKNITSYSGVLARIWEIDYIKK